MLSRVRSLVRSNRGNYAYVVARVRALKTHLLAQDAYPRMLQRDVHEIARSLQEGRYKAEIDELGSEASGAALVERATRLNMGREFSRILSWCQGEPRTLMELYFQRYDVQNVKTVLRGAQAGVARDETEAALVPAGVVAVELYAAALDARSIDDALTALADTPYGAVAAEMRGKRLAEIENELDIAYYRTLTRSAAGQTRATDAFLQFLRREVDIVNLKLVCRTKHAGLDDYELVPGGRELTPELARRVAAAQWSEMAATLDDTPYGAVLKPAIEAYQEHRDLNEVVNALDHYHVNQAAAFGHLYPLSILPVVDYVLRKKREVDAIRIVAFGKQAELSNDELEALVLA